MSGFYLPPWVVWLLENARSVLLVLGALGGYGIWLLLRRLWRK